MKTILAGLFAVLVLASLLIITIQAENTALSSGVPVNLTADSPANDQNPAWSPNGQRILFTSGRSGNNDLWLMDDDAPYRGAIRQP